MESATLPRQTLLAVAASQWAYWCSFAVSALAVRFVPAGVVRNAVMGLPLVTGLLCFSVAYWLYEACDEYVRAALLRCIVRTAAIVALATVLYFIAELAGVQRLSMLWVNLFGWSVFNLQLVAIIFRSR
jgi:hypothetical protein